MEASIGPECSSARSRRHTAICPCNTNTLCGALAPCKLLDTIQGAGYKAFYGTGRD